MRGLSPVPKPLPWDCEIGRTGGMIDGSTSDPTTTIRGHRDDAGERHPASSDPEQGEVCDERDDVPERLDDPGADRDRDVENDEQRQSRESGSPIESRRDEQHRREGEDRDQELDAFGRDRRHPLRRDAVGAFEHERPPACDRVTGRHDREQRFERRVDEGEQHHRHDEPGEHRLPGAASQRLGDADGEQRDQHREDGRRQPHASLQQRTHAPRRRRPTRSRTARGAATIEPPGSRRRARGKPPTAGRATTMPAGLRSAGSAAAAGARNQREPRTYPL